MELAFYALVATLGTTGLFVHALELRSHRPLPFHEQVEVTIARSRRARGG